MEITFKGRHTSVPERFRRHATAKLAKLEKLDQRAIRIDVEVSTERNPRQADRSERVELTIRSRGPAIRAEAAADDRYAALDLAFAKLEGRLRKAAERRKVSRGGLTVRGSGLVRGDALVVRGVPGRGGLAHGVVAGGVSPGRGLAAGRLARCLIGWNVCAGQVFDLITDVHLELGHDSSFSPLLPGGTGVVPGGTSTRNFPGVATPRMAAASPGLATRCCEPPGLANPR